MLGTLVAFLAFIAVFTLLYKFATQTVGRRVGRFVDRHHRTTEVLLETRGVPEQWRHEVRRRFPVIGDDRTERRARRFLIRRLDRLARYFERTPLVDSEETRRLIIDQLVEIAEEWEKASLAGLVAEEASA